MASSRFIAMIGWSLLSRRQFCAGSAVSVIALLTSNCTAGASSTDKERDLTTVQSLFGILDDGRCVDLFTLRNAGGMEVQISTLGAAITSLKVPDPDGQVVDVVLGFDNPQSYLDEKGYFGVVIGRYANRIARGRFAIERREYQLPINNGPNHLHGGDIGFDKHVWQPRKTGGDGWVGIELSLVSPDGDQGYPGELRASVEYRLDQSNRLSVIYNATTDAPTIVNLSQHSYFNLDGHGSGDVLEHELMLNADRFTPIDETGIPIGKIAKVAGTPLDFREVKPIGRDIESPHEQIIRGSGYDHNWMINGDPSPGGMVKAAYVRAPKSGRTMTVYTDKPGVQFYSANFLNGQRGKDGVTYPKRSGLCLETQFFPDSPNNAAFPSAQLHQGETYAFQTVFEFGLI